MNKDISIFDLSDAQLEQIQKKYELIEPLLDEYLSLDEKRRHAHMAREQLQISERTLRRYVQHLREEGPRRLARKKRSDSREDEGVSSPDPQASRRAAGAESFKEYSYAHETASSRR